MSLPAPGTSPGTNQGPSQADQPFVRRLLFVCTTIYTILLITRPHEFIPQLAESPILQILILFSFGIWLLVPEKGTDLPHFLILPFFVLFVWCSLIAAGWVGGIVPALGKLMPPMLLFVIISGSIRTLREFKIYSAVVIACACVIVYHGYLQTTYGIGWTLQPMIEGRITYSGIFNDPNDIGLLLVVGIAMCSFHMRTLQSRLLRWLTALALCALLYGVYLTDSRGTMLATMTVLGLVAWRRYGKTAVICAAIAIVPVLFATTRLAELDAEEESAENRVEAWYEGVELLKQHPLFGVGYGMFSDYNAGLTAHNSLVLAMAELGLAGYTFWIALVFLTGSMIYNLAFPYGTGPPTGSAPAPAAGATGKATASAGASPRPAVAAMTNARVDLFTPRPRVPVAAAAAAASAAVAAAPVAGAAAMPENERIERLAAEVLLFGAAGFAVGAFFLSQSYKPMLFIVCGLVAARYLGMREAGFSVPRVTLQLPLMFGITLASVVALWFLVRILL